MATGNRSVPGAPVTAEHTAAGRPVTDEQANWAGWPAQGFSVGPAAAEQVPSARSSSVPGAASASQASDGDLPQGQVPRRLWRGSGGRWMVWVLRAVLWAVLLLIGYRGVAAIVTGTPVGETPTAARGDGFPVSLAKAYALEFGQAYLNFNPATAQRRASTLAGFLLPGTSPQDGLTGAGTLTLQSEQVAGVRVVNAHRAVVMLLARVNGNLLELAVPVYASDGGLVVSGQPGLFPPPIQAIPPQRASGPADLAARRSLGALLPAFFRAYASGNALELGKFAAHGAAITGLGGVVEFGGIRRLFVPAVAGPVRRITVTVMWRTGGAPPPAAATHAASPPASHSARPSVSAPARSSASPAARSSASPAAPSSVGPSARSFIGPSASPAASRAARPEASPAASGPAGPLARPVEIDMTYALTVVRDGGTWLVRWIGPAIEQPWASP
jgi:conjugative transposon protein TcpC